MISCDYSFASALKLPLHLQTERVEDAEYREGPRLGQLSLALPDLQTLRKQSSWANSSGFFISAASKYRCWHSGTREGRGGEHSKKSALIGCLLNCE